MIYVAVIDHHEGIWGARFPDIPGCVGGGATIEEAIANAEIALREAVTYRRNGGLAVPAATDIATLRSQGQIAPNENTALVALK